ncbi:MAG: decaprenyl-phosphate phosphoribosyltransferase [Solirubrobacteraceae bacterium]
MAQLVRVSSPFVQVRFMWGLSVSPMLSGAGGSLLPELNRREPLPAASYADADRRDISGVEVAAPDVVGGESRRRRLRATLVTARPRQWIKNALVVAAAGAAGALGHDDVPGRVALACAAFCLLASGIYAINDVRDAPEDRRHPRKRYRPVAAGELDPSAALGAGAVMMLAGLALCAFLRPLLLLVGVGYVALTLSYTLFWRRILVLDVVAIAGGFVLRAIAGGVAAPVTLSSWFVLVVTFVAVFVAAGKRHAELCRSAETRPPRRRVLEAYTTGRLRLILIVSGVAALGAYCMWAFELPVINGIPWRLLTGLPFAACLARYGALVGTGDTEAPEDVLLSDRWLQVAGLAWLVLFALGIHAAS